MSSTPYIAIPVHHLDKLICRWERRGGRWTLEEACIDLARWVDQVTAPGSRVEWPRVRDLAARWGWTTRSGTLQKNKVCQLLADHGAWLDGRKVDAMVEAAGWDPDRVQAWVGRGPDRPSGQERDGFGTGTGRIRDRNGTADEDERQQSDATRDRNGTDSGQERDRSGTDSGTRAENNHRSPPTVHLHSGSHTDRSGGSERGGVADVPADRVCDAQRVAPDWLHQAAGQFGWSVPDAARAIAATGSALRGETRTARQSQHVIQPLVKLVLAEGYQPDDLIRDVELVADAARDCPARCFAFEIRGEGHDFDWLGSAQQTLKVDRWPVLLRTARGWHDEGRPTAAAPSAPLSVADAPEPPADVAAVARRLTAAREASQPVRPLGVPAAPGVALADDPDEHDVLLAALLWQIGPGDDPAAAWLDEYTADPEGTARAWPLSDPTIAAHLRREGAVSAMFDQGAMEPPSDQERVQATAVQRAAGETLRGVPGLLAGLVVAMGQPSLLEDPISLVPALRWWSEQLDEEHADWRSDPVGVGRKLGVQVKPALELVAGGAHAHA